MSYTIESDLVATCCKIAKAMRVELELVGQRRAKGSGTTRGFPDGVLHAGGRTYLVEFKRPKSVGTRAGRVSLDQVAAAARIPTVARVVDLTPAFCTPDRCLSVVGGVIVYRDRSHLSDAYARLLAPVLDQALAKEGR